MTKVRVVTQQAIDEAEIQQRINMLVEAIRAMDVDSVMSFYAADIVSFDVVHDQVSVPVDFERGKALLNLHP